MQKKLVAFFFIYILSMLSTLTDDYCTSQIQGLLQSLEGNEFLIWKFGLLSISVQLVLPLLTTLLIIWFLFANHEHLGQFIKKHFQQLCIENLRSWGFILLAGLFLIFPAFIVYYLYSYVPFIVVLSQKYDRGEVDALKYSRQLVFQSPIKLLFVSLVTLALLPMINSGIFSEYNSFISNPASAIPLHFIEVGIQFLAIYFIGKLFLNSEKILNGDSHAATHV